MQNGCICPKCGKYTKDIKGHGFTCPKQIKKNIESFIDIVVSSFNDKKNEEERMKIDEERERNEFMKNLSGGS